MISPQLEAQILRLFHVEKWKVGGIADQLGIHHDVVRRVLAYDGIPRPRPERPSRIDPYLPFILETLRRYAKVPASRLYDMCRERGYRGSPDHFRHLIARHRPRKPAEAFQRVKARLVRATLSSAKRSHPKARRRHVRSAPKDHGRAVGRLRRYRLEKRASQLGQAEPLTPPSVGGQVLELST